MIALLIASSDPFAPDQVAVPLLFSVRLESTTFADAGKLMPAFIFVVPFIPTMHDAPLSFEHIVPPAQFSGVEKTSTPGESPPITPPLKFTVVVEIASVPVPKFMVAPLKFTVPVPLIGPVNPKILPEKLT